MTGAIADYEARKAECVPVNIDEVTHVFYHSLVVDPIKCFSNRAPGCGQQPVDDDHR